MPDTEDKLPPLPWNWHDRAVMWLDGDLGKFLDYGCGNGSLLTRVKHRCEECHGVDVNPEPYAEIANENPELHFSTISVADGKTDYPDNYFDTISITEVIEHVPDERATLTELARILKPGGRLFLTTRHKGLLSCFDTGNLKFLLPGMHHFVHRRVLRDHEYYQKRFESTKDIGLVGDVSTSNGRSAWHRHYRRSEIETHCPPELEVVKSSVFFPGERLLGFISLSLRIATFGKFRPFPWPLPSLQRSLSQKETKMGDELVILFTKTA